MEAPFKFDVTFENGSYKIKNGRDLCLEFEFIEDEDDGGTVLYISKIFKCGDGMPLTRKVINLIETMAKSIPAPPWSRIKYIKLEDGSSIHVCTVDIDLRYLKILTTGESWYNSFGYKSVNHDANVAHNAVIINKPMDELLPELYDQEYIEEFKSLFPELSTELTVKEYVTAMTKEVPKSGTRSCTEEQENKAELLFNLVHSIGRSEMLEYDFRLQKMVERGASRAGGKRNKKSRRNQRSKRSQRKKRSRRSQRKKRSRRTKRLIK